MVLRDRAPFGFLFAETAREGEGLMSGSATHWRWFRLEYARAACTPRAKLWDSGHGQGGHDASDSYFDVVPHQVRRQPQHTIPEAVVIVVSIGGERGGRLKFTHGIHRTEREQHTPSPQLAKPPIAARLETHAWRLNLHSPGYAQFSRNSRRGPTRFKLVREKFAFRSHMPL